MLRQPLHCKDMTFQNFLFSSRKVHKYQWFWYHYREIRRSTPSRLHCFENLINCWRDGWEEGNKAKKCVPHCLESNASASSSKHSERLLVCSQNTLYKIHIGFMPYMPNLYFDTGLRPEPSENILLSACNIVECFMAFFKHNNTRLVRFNEASDQLLP